MKEFFFSVILPWAGIFLAIYLVYYAFRFQYSKQPLEKQLYKVYLPMFMTLEPVLYKKISDIGYHKVQEIIDELNVIVDNHYELTYPSIVHWCRLLKRRLNEPEYPQERKDKLFNYLCHLVDREFEKTRKKMFLPTRSLSYRLNNNQFRNRNEMIAGILILSFPQLLTIVTMLSLSWFIMNWLSN